MQMNTLWLQNKEIQIISIMSAAFIAYFTYDTLCKNAVSGILKNTFRNYAFSALCKQCI